MQMVWREVPAVEPELVRRRHDRLGHGLHAALVRQPVALAQVAARAGGDDVAPGGLAAPRAWDDVIEGQLRRRMGAPAVLAGEAVAQEDVEPRERRPTILRDILLERHHAGQPELEAGRADHPIIVADDRHAIEEDRLDRVLPAPQRQGVVGQWLIVGVEDQGRKRREWHRGVRPAHQGLGLSRSKRSIRGIEVSSGLGPDRSVRDAIFS